MASAPSHPPASGQEGSHTAQWWLEQVKAQERRGELLLAFDLADRGLAQHPGDLALAHRAVLALARAGATELAAARFEQYGLAGAAGVDVAAVGARIAKDVALAAHGAQRARSAASAAARYGEIYARTGGYYPAINAATLWLIAGDAPRARQLAREVLDVLAATAEDSYSPAVTAGEAQLLRGRPGDAAAALARGVALNDGDYGALASTRRQLRTICELLGVDAGLLSVLAGPAVVHFCGHRIAAAGAAGRFAADAEAAVMARIVEAVEAHRAGFAYGSLASGGNIMWAEALLARGCELHIVLPFALEQFVALSVASSGAGWVARFHRCLQAASTVEYATHDAFLGDDVLFRYGSELAMGLALLRARHLDTEARQLALWDGGPAHGAAGTSIDVASWRRTGRPVTVVAPAAELPVAPAAELPVAPAAELPVADAAPRTPAKRRRASARRVVRALLFGDIKGFSRLNDEQLPVFATRVLGAFAAVVQRHRDSVWHRNTWGDALYVVLTDAPAAAACALDLQDAMAAIDLAADGLPADLALRLGGHLGPVFPTHDPVLDELAFMGSHVSRTARIEPVTPPGAVYVTEQFAAALVLSASRRFACDYVGRMPAAKGYGRLRMYRLRRAGSGDLPAT